MTKIKTRKIRLAVWGIDIDEVKIRKLGGLDAAFSERVAIAIGLDSLNGGRFRILIWWVKVSRDGKWFEFGKNSGTRIAWTLCAVPNFLIVWQVKNYLFFFSFGFL